MLNINGLIKKSRSRNRNRKQHNGLIGKTRLNGPIAIGPCLYTPRAYYIPYIRRPRSRAPVRFIYIFFRPIYKNLWLFQKFGFHKNIQGFFPWLISTIDRMPNPTVRAKSHHNVSITIAMFHPWLPIPNSIPAVDLILWSNGPRKIASQCFKLHAFLFHPRLRSSD